MATGLTKDDLVTIAANQGAHLLIPTLLANCDALTARGFTKNDLVKIAAKSGANQRLRILLEKWDYLFIFKNLTIDEIVTRACQGTQALLNACK